MVTALAFVPVPQLIKAFNALDEAVPDHLRE
jgi:hypothetical protein